MCFVNVNSRDYHFKSLWLAWIVFDSRDLWMPVFFCKKYISSTIQGGILLISSSRVVGPAGHWYLLMRFVSSTRFLYTRPFLKSTKTCFAPLKMDSFGKTILGFLTFLGANKSKKQHFHGHFGSFWEGYNGRRVRSITYTPLTPNPGCGWRITMEF